MKKIRFSPSLILLAVFLAGCAPAESAAPTELPTANQPSTVIVPTATIDAPTLEAATQPVPSEEVTALPVATSRGPDLEATDPTTVNLASGGLQFVEFFRFT